MFKVSPASLQTFIDTPNCVLEDRVQYSPVHIPNIFCDGHLQIVSCVGIIIVRVHRDFLITLYFLSFSQPVLFNVKITLFLVHKLREVPSIIIPLFTRHLFILQSKHLPSCPLFRSCHGLEWNLWRNFYIIAVSCVMTSSRQYWIFWVSHAFLFNKRKPFQVRTLHRTSHVFTIRLKFVFHTYTVTI
jgi:hypothetical protein